MTCDIMNISRLRMASDGEGVSTLITFFGCPLNCKYCINDYCHDQDKVRGSYTPDKLYEKLLIDDIYFKMTGGGIVFGGGEPLLQAPFIHELCAQCNPMWQKRIETSLYSEWDNIKLLMKDLDEWIIDIKDVNPIIYKYYTGQDNSLVIDNLKKLLKEVPAESVKVRVPHIKNFNNNDDVEKSISFLKNLGITTIDEFTYMQTKPLALDKNRPDKSNNLRATSIPVPPDMLLK